MLFCCSYIRYKDIKDSILRKGKYYLSSSLCSVSWDIFIYQCWMCRVLYPQGNLLSQVHLIPSLPT